MKKLFSMLLFVAAASLATSCDKIEDLAGDLKDEIVDDVIDALLGNETEGMTLYTGTVSLSNGYPVSDDFKVYAEEEDGELKITMLEAKFAEKMPIIDITLSDLDLNSEGAFSEATVVPNVVMEVNGIDVKVGDVKAFTCSDVAGTHSAVALEFEVTCMGCTVSFEGTAE